MLLFQPEYGRKGIRKALTGRSGIVASWAWMTAMVEGKERVSLVVVLDDRRFDLTEVGIGSALVEIGQLERFHFHHGDNDGAQELENMPWQAWLLGEKGLLSQ